MSARKPWRRGSMLPPNPPPAPGVPSRFQASQQAGAIPPSSAVALIVQNLPKASDGRDAAPVPEKEAFQALLNELFQEGDGNDDIAQNQAIIPIITGAGLSVLLKDDPFASLEELMKQAENSLLVLQIIIRRTPECLFTPPPPESSQKNQIYLGLWLLAKLFPVLAHGPAQPLADEILNTIRGVFSAAANVGDDAVYLRTMVDFCQSCYHSVLWTFGEKSTVKSTLAKSFELTLPPDTFSVSPKSWKGLHEFEPLSLQFKIQDPEAAGLIVLHLYTLYIKLSVTEYGNPMLQHDIERLAVFQQGLGKIWSTLNIWATLPVMHEKTESLRVRILEALENSLVMICPRTAGVIRTDGLHFLTTRCLLDVLKRPADRNNQLIERATAGIILQLLMAMKQSPLVRHLIRDRLLPPAHVLMSDESAWKLLCHDLQISLLKLASYINGELDEHQDALFQATGGEWVCKHNSLDAKMQNIQNFITPKTSQPTPTNPGDQYPNKRQRLGDPQEESPLTALVSSVYSLLGSHPAATDLGGLSQVAAAGYIKLSELQQCTAVDYLGLLSCAYARTVERISSPDGMEYEYRCAYCDAYPESRGPTPGYVEAGEDKEILDTLKVLIRLDEFNESATVKTRAMRGLKRVTAHTRERSYLSLEKSPLGSWGIGGLFSSKRELRIAAGRNLPMFVQEWPEREEVARGNRMVIARELHTVTEPKLQETCVLAWGQLGRIYKATDLNLVLVQLVEYLGHSSPFITGVALNELAEIAHAHETSPRRLISPFYRSISYPVVKHLITKPQIADNLLAFMVMDVVEFLRATQIYTLPYLVLARQRDVIKRIADANDGKELQILCHDNIAPILSVLLVQDVENPEVNAQKLLEYVSPVFANSSIGELVRPDAVPIAAELLKSLGDAEAETRTRIIKALKLVAKRCDKKNTRSKTAQELQALGNFFHMHVLGLCQHFSESLREPNLATPLQEKIRCLNAVKEMLELAKSYVADAMPQITAYVQQAMEFDDLRQHAAVAWTAIARNLEDHVVMQILGQTFALILQYWGKFDDGTKRVMLELLTYLFTERRSVIKEVVDILPRLDSIPKFAKYQAKLDRWRGDLESGTELSSLLQRLKQENGAVVEQALVELVVAIKKHESKLHESVMNEKPEEIVSQIIRSVLDVILRFKDAPKDLKARIDDYCGECLGLIGALDPTQVEAPRETQVMIVLHYFSRAEESKDFVLFFLEKVLVKAFLAATESKSQLLLAWAAQELLKFCDLNQDNVFPPTRSAAGSLDKSTSQRKWESLPPSIQATLTPFLSSKYFLNSSAPIPTIQYPVFEKGITYRGWINTFLQDIMSNYVGENATEIFGTCLRILKGQSIQVLHFLLPYAVTQVVINGKKEERERCMMEFLTVMKWQFEGLTVKEQRVLRVCSEAVFMVTDYMAKWLRARRNFNIDAKNRARQVRNVHAEDTDPDADFDEAATKVNDFLKAIPPDLMALRSMEVHSYPRALQYWEQHMRQSKPMTPEESEPLYKQLQKMYVNIDEPDGMEGTSAKITNLNMDMQVLEHRKAGRWTEALTWYEQLVEQSPDEVQVQGDLVTCLRESGQYDNLLRQVDGMMVQSPASQFVLLPYAVEASWVTGKWEHLDRYLGMGMMMEPTRQDYDICLGQALSALRKRDMVQFREHVRAAREEVVGSMTESTASSVRQCHSLLVKLHALSELTEITSDLSHDGDLSSAILSRGTTNQNSYPTVPGLKDRLDMRLQLLGMYDKDKQYILALRRAAFDLAPKPQLNPPPTTIKLIDDLKVSAWLSTARLARKHSSQKQAFTAIHHAMRISHPLSLVEHSKLLWTSGQQWDAIRNLTAALENHTLEFDAHQEDQMVGGTSVKDSVNSTRSNSNSRTGGLTSLRVAKAKLLQAKWVDETGRLESIVVLQNYRDVSQWSKHWERGYYHLGRYYNRLYEQQEKFRTKDQMQEFCCGELAKLVVTNYARALRCGVKYIFQTMPRLLTVWLTLGDSTELADKEGVNEKYIQYVERRRKQNLQTIHDMLMRQVMEQATLTPWMFYTAFPQIISRLTHQNGDVYNCLEQIILKVMTAHPQHALWSICPVSKSTDRTRSSRGARLFKKITASSGRKAGPTITTPQGKTISLGDLGNAARKLTDTLIRLCRIEIPGKVISVRLSKDPLNLNPAAMAPVDMFIPSQQFFAVMMPPPNITYEELRKYDPFMSDIPTIEAFEEKVEVMNSLQKPRRIYIRGSDGKQYSFLCKPKDDLRKDQRLLEFSAMIDRFLKKDAESHRRRLYIRTYSVTPLNEDSGLIEWVNNIRTIRDIILKNLSQRGIHLNFAEIRTLLDSSLSRRPSSTAIFTNQILPQFPPVFYDWFLTNFSEPSAWFEGRLRYTRTAAVMSMVGTIIGLGDRHGENILIDTVNGDIVHVDFNCLFDKGLSFEKPERVPFRLTQNMVDAFGPTGVEGVFRKACESTIRLLRHNEETMMTVLEAFTHDQPLDMIQRSSKNKPTQPGVFVAPKDQKDCLQRIEKRLRGIVEEAERGRDEEAGLGGGGGVDNLGKRQAGAGGGGGGTGARSGGIESYKCLSPEGQVDVLIRRAVDPENLKHMYIGWCPFL